MQQHFQIDPQMFQRAGRECHCHMRMGKDMLARCTGGRNEKNAPVVPNIALEDGTRHRLQGRSISNKQHQQRHRKIGLCMYSPGGHMCSDRPADADI